MKRIVNGDFTLPGLGLPRFFATYADFASLEVDVVPLEILQLSFTHPSIEKREVDRIQLGRAGFKKALARTDRADYTARQCS